MHTPMNASRELINERFIISLKRLISAKHGAAQVSERAAILADALHRAIDSRLPDVPSAMKVSLRFKLLELGRERGRFRITADDIFTQCLAQLDVAREEMIKPISEWARKQLQLEDKVGLDDVAAVIKQLDASGKQPLTEPLIALQHLLQPPCSSSLDKVSIEAVKAHEETSRQPVGIVEQELAAASATSPAEPVPFIQRISIPKNIAAAAIFLGIMATSIPLITAFNEAASTERTAPFHISLEDLNPMNIVEPYEGMPNDLPEALQYTLVSKGALKQWLEGRNSLLAEEVYFDTIIDTASDHNIHPLLLFAITGQEQGFVPKDHPNAERIANNPFNVYHSWQDYNTTIEDSARIATVTIVNLSKDRPADIHPLQWINRKYAEDPEWWVGVDKLFQQLQRAVSE